MRRCTMSTRVHCKDYSRQSEHTYHRHCLLHRNPRYRPPVACQVSIQGIEKVKSMQFLAITTLARRTSPFMRCIQKEFLPLEALVLLP